MSKLDDHNFCQMTFVNHIDQLVGSMMKNYEKASNDGTFPDDERDSREWGLLEDLKDSVRLAKEIYAKEDE